MVFIQHDAIAVIETGWKTKRTHWTQACWIIVPYIALNFAFFAFFKYILSLVLALHLFDAFAYYCQARKNNDWSSFSRTGENSGWLCFLIRPTSSHTHTYARVTTPCHRSAKVSITVLRWNAKSPCSRASSRRTKRTSPRCHKQTRF